MVGEGRPIAAAKYVVRATDLGLRDGKQYVDAMRAGLIATSGGTADRPLSERVRAFIAAGDVPSAIALVRSETGMGAREAELFVAALE
jgi:hypothetical protein